MHHVLVTGGAGFIGSNYILRYLDHANCLVNLDALTYAGNLANLVQVESKPNYHFVHGNIGDFDLVLKLLHQHHITAVINFAAESHVDRSIDTPEPFILTNVLGTTRLLDATKKYWDQLPPLQKTQFRFLHISTDEVFGSLTLEDAPFTEETPYSPRSPYSSSKAASDHLVRAYHHTYGLPTIITNCSNNYGPYQYPEKLIPLIIHHAIHGKDLPIYGDGSNIRDWIYVQDHCDAVQKVLLDGRIGETYCIGGNAERKNIEIVNTIVRILDELRPRSDGLSYQTQIKFVADRLGHDYRYAVNTSKISRELGWKPKADFSQGIRETIEWYLHHESWIETILSGKNQPQRHSPNA